MWKIYKYDGKVYEFYITDDEIVLSIEDKMVIEKPRESFNMKTDMKSMVDKGMWKMIDDM